MQKHELEAICEGISPAIAKTHTLLVKTFVALAMQPSIDLAKLIADFEMLCDQSDPNEQKSVEQIVRLLRNLEPLHRKPERLQD